MHKSGDLDWLLLLDSKSELDEILQRHPSTILSEVKSDLIPALWGMQCKLNTYGVAPTMLAAPSFGLHVYSPF